MGAITAVGIGEILWDVLPGGRKLGGAPANFAFHVNGLGGRGLIVSRLGQDAWGDEALQVLGANGLNLCCVTRDPQHPTGTVEARLDEAGVATYVFPDNVAWDFLELNPAAFQVAQRAQAVCFGTLAQRSAISRAAVHQFLRATPRAALRVFDVNLRGDMYSREVLESSLDLADALKVSDAELPVLARIFGLPEGDQERLAALVERYGLRLAALTRGGQGSLLATPGAVSDHPGFRVEVADTIGAGDAFGAAMTLGFLAGWDLDAVNVRANEVAAFVCTRPGAMQAADRELRILG